MELELWKLCCLLTFGCTICFDSSNAVAGENDICDTWGICGQACELTRDGYKCVCHDGFEIQDGYSCKPINGTDETFIIFTNRHEIRRVNIGSKKSVSILFGLRNTIALEFYYKKKWVFWTDLLDKKIYRGTMIDDAIKEIRPIVEVGIGSTEGMALDWVSEKLYWIDSAFDQIDVARFDGTGRTTLITGVTGKPRAMVLDPREGALFWTDWRYGTSSIWGCSLSGEERTSFLNVTAGGAWPNGLTVDLDFRRLYWVDAKSDSIHSIKYNGEDHRLIVEDLPSLSHPFGISLFGEYVYWTDWKTNGITRANKFNGSNSEMVIDARTQPFDIQVFSPYRQPYAPNPCADNNGGCSHLCLLNYRKTTGCRCPYLMKLSEDGKTCKNVSRFFLFARRNEIHGVGIEDGNLNIIPSVTKARRPSAVDYDVIQERIYWADTVLDAIHSVFLNGTGLKSIVDTDEPKAMAIDWISRNMYFSSNTSKGVAILVSNLNGEYRHVLIAQNISSPNSLAVHPTLGYLFWSDDGGAIHKIVRSMLDGSETKVLAEGEDVKMPGSLSIDFSSNKLYWINKETGKIRFCDFDGETQDSMDISRDVEEAMSITVYREFLYVAGRDLIGSLSKDGHSFREFRSATKSVQSMTVYDSYERTSGTNACSVDNGRCGQLCLPVGTPRWACKCMTGYELAPNNRDCLGFQSFLMYSIGREIKGISLDSTDKSTETLATISSANWVSSLDFYADEDTIYWAGNTTKTISRIKRDLTGRETIIDEGLEGVESLAVDWMAKNVYWTNYERHTIEVSRLDGSSRYVISHENMDKPRAITLHPERGLMFWCDLGTGKIERAVLDGTDRKIIIETEIQAPNALTIDFDTETLYWCDQQLNTIEQCDFDGGSRKTIRRHLISCQSITVFGDYIYWVDSSFLQGSISRANKTDGSERTIIRSGMGSNIKDLKIYDKLRQQGLNDCSFANGGCSELCLRTDKTTSCACSFGRVQSDGSCKDYDEFLVYSESAKIKSITLEERINLNPPIRPFQHSSNMKNIISLASDFSKKVLFFSDIKHGNIQQVFFNNTGFKVIAKGEGSVEGLAYDPHSQYLYWTSFTNSTIMRKSLDPRDQNATKELVLRLQPEDHPRAIVINSCGRPQGQIFWTNWNTMYPAIQRCNMDGSDMRDIITSYIGTPNGITIDYKASVLFWTDARSDKIERCDFNGQNRMVIWTRVSEHPFGVAVFGNYLYWTDWIRETVFRANKFDGSEVVQLRQRMAYQPMSIIAVGKETNDCQSNPCHMNTIGCSHNCSVSLEGLAYCTCPEGQLLMADKITCSN